MTKRFALGAILALGACCVALLASGRVLIVRSSSMDPVFRAGDAIVVWPLSGLPTLGDVVIYEAQGALITHRVVEVRADGVITKGDANRERDGWVVRPEDIRGRMVARVPFLGWFLAFLQRPSGWVLFVLVPSGLVIVLEVRRTTAALRRRRKKVETDDVSQWTI
jgi:signal peptidase